MNNLKITYPTIIITFVKHRQNFLERLIKYYKNYNGEIIIVGPKINILNKDRKIKYIINNDQNCSNKLLATKKYVKSKNLIWVGEDDFVFEDYIYEANKILNKDPKISVVESFYLDFFEKKFELAIKSMEEYHIERKKNLLYNDLHGRLKYFSKFNGNICHSVMRKNIFFDIIKIYNDKIIDDSLNDKIFYLGLLLKGKIYYLNILGHLRSQLISVNKIEKKVELSEILKNKKINKYLIKKLSKFSKNKITYEIINIYVKKYNKNLIYKKKNIFFNRFTNTISKILLGIRFNSLKCLLKFYNYPILSKNSKLKLEIVKKIIIR